MRENTIEILLVEDSEDDSAFFMHALDGESPARIVQIARDGAEALAMLFGGQDPALSPPLFRPKLIVLDLKLPKIGGLEVLEILKRNPQTKSIPVIILSSSQEKRDLEESYRLGANSYLVKPMDFDAFSELVRTLSAYWAGCNQPANG